MILILCRVKSNFVKISYIYIGENNAWKYKYQHANYEKKSKYSVFCQKNSRSCSVVYLDRGCNIIAEPMN